MATNIIFQDPMALVEFVVMILCLISMIKLIIGNDVQTTEVRSVKISRLRPRNPLLQVENPFSLASLFDVGKLVSLKKI